MIGQNWLLHSLAGASDQSMLRVKYCVTLTLVANVAYVPRGIKRGRYTELAHVRKVPHRNALNGVTALPR